MARRVVSRNQAVSPETWPHIEAIRLSWVFTTKEAHNGSIAAEMTTQIGKLIILDAEMQFRVRFSLQEAVINAFFHGNLGLPSLPGSVEGLDAFGQELKIRLSKPELAQKNIYVTTEIFRDRIELAIRDEGEGFKHGEAIIHNPFFGRGLRLVEQCADAVAYDQEKCTLHITLKRA
ncbi:MAG: ATP-binding protein [Alphaproteobacteria bacterium]|jgi:anti-sigma regulatory factor (Ser/Thr protein kinase)|nr:ATP-binding protein [Thalassospira sp.]MCE2964692.1 ATP-binding protein [Alphaproteobacteria bacterium]